MLLQQQFRYQLQGANSFLRSWKLKSIISHKMILFITIAVGTSNPTKLKCVQMVKEFPIFYAARSFITVFKRTWIWIPSGTFSVQTSVHFTQHFRKVCLSIIFPPKPASSKWYHLFRVFRPRKVSLHEICKYAQYNNLNEMATSPEMHYLQFLFHLSGRTVTQEYTACNLCSILYAELW
jgi:hypothetical protein